MERSVKEDTFDSSAVVLGSPFVAELVSVSASRPGHSTETRWTSRTQLRIRREADLLFKAVDVLGVVSDQPASIAQATDEMVCPRRNGTLGEPTYLSDVLVEETSASRIEEHRGMEKATAATGIRAIF